MSIRSSSSPAAALVTALLGVAVAAAQDRAPDVAFVPTPVPVVERMLELARVSATDLVYDLGSGDGRVPIIAAQRFGARGVGFEINPVWVRDARANAERAGVADRVAFSVEDLFEADLREATVVTPYLLPPVNRRLQPKLERELRPGARVVSHEYLIGDWPPDHTETITVRGESHVIHLWRVK